MSATTTPTKPRAKKPAAKPKAARKEPSFPANISFAVAYARRELHARKPGLGDRRPPAASAGDHLAVRARLTEPLGGDITADRVLKATGLTLPRLEAVARFEPSSADDMKTMRDNLGKELHDWPTNAAWRSGRYAAGIIAAWVRELRAS